jgi:hypothetical protein
MVLLFADLAASIGDARWQCAGVYRVIISSLRERWSVRGQSPFINRGRRIEKLHTYLDGISPFMYLGLWATGLPP